jgi:hypothetical protein
LHRENGPAHVRRGSDGSILLEEYFLYGRRVTEAEMTPAPAKILEAKPLKDATDTGSAHANEQPSKTQAPQTGKKNQDLDRLIEDQDKIARAKQDPLRTEPQKERERER